MENGQPIYVEYNKQGEMVGELGEAVGNLSSVTVPNPNFLLFEFPLLLLRIPAEDEHSAALKHWVMPFLP
ncbi:hypothetical protein MNBD_GAMMA16-1685 [hydrothermal vent metagenome]|uniref:Uncharacterized protein n=1 Tax=hydrothermal vent metagenome TaxID=652676 RepID=A0A3B0ZIF2_9ZZZZ